MSRAGKPRVAYYYNTDIGHHYYGPGHPMKPHRMKLTHHLIMGYGLYRKMECYRPHLASADELARFHSEDYVDFLRRVTPENCKAMTTQMQKYNIGEYTDCPVFDGLYNFCQAYGGASIDGAVRLNHGLADVAINWAGGLHHAKKCEASGFCYVNDIVLGILELLKHHQRVLYIDIDVHHGDGVEEAFYTTDRVMTVSFHKFGDFFPGTGAIRDIGARGGKGYSVNFPLNDGIDDLSYEHVFKPVIQRIMDVYRPGAVALQCGADSLTGDRLGCFNLTLKGHAEAVKFVRSFGLPTLVMGGGGYTIRNVARCWANETATVLGETLPDVIPPNDYIEYYRPDYRLHLDASTDMENRNSAGYLEKCKAVILENLRGLQAAPSVAFQERPPDWSVREVEEELRSLGGSLNPDVRPGQPGSDVAPGSAGAGVGGSLSAAPSMLSGLGGVEGTREHDAELYDHERDIDRDRGVPTGDDGMIDVEAARAEAAAARAGSSSSAAAGSDGVETVAEGASATLAAVGSITGPDGSSSAAAQVYALATGDAAGADSSAAEVAAAADAAAAGAADVAEQALADAASAGGTAGQEPYREGGGGGEDLADL